MDARARNLVFLAAILSVAASHRTTNFLVSCDDPQLARQVAQSAEQYRRQIALSWLGHELPRWQDICPIQVKVGNRLGAGGQTSFTFENRRPGRWQMIIQGSRQRILDSVLPHEITHTVFASHFGQRLPRWADEGACTTVEHISERRKQQQLLVQFLTSDRGIPFNVMYRIAEYPDDIMPLYAQGYSVARYLLAHGGQRRFVAYLETGLANGDWDQATRKHYGHTDLSQLQNSWISWVQKGCPSPEQAATAVRQASAKIPATGTPAVAKGWRQRNSPLLIPAVHSLQPARTLRR
jgi:hypothetical protein